MEDNANPLEVTALIVHQWLKEWDEVKFSDDEALRRRKPEPYFFVFSLSAKYLRRLSNVYRRRATGPRNEDTAIQRSHDKKRSLEIARFVRGGFPWSDLSETQKKQNDFKELKMLGWLPTAIIANILAPNEKRQSNTIDEQDVVKVDKINDKVANIILPNGLFDQEWDPIVRPLEIIDGQHRLYAFEEEDNFDNYELPVVAFYNLDITWQAYLFYTINIKPKKINPSLAFDLYPILRIQDWLQPTQDAPTIYKDTRAQELTETLWSYQDSPWYERINMLGDKGGGRVSQASFVRAIKGTYLRRWETNESKIGGLFGAELEIGTTDVLVWNRVQQASFLIFVWQCFAEATHNTQADWAVKIRRIYNQSNANLDRAFTSEYSLFTTDQGVRGLLWVTNDMCYVIANQLKLNQWVSIDDANDLSTDVVDQYVKNLEREPVAKFLEQIATHLCENFDWRTSGFPNLEEEIRRRQMVFRGAPGYQELRKQLLQTLESSQYAIVRNAATEVLQKIGYRK